jgi:hypothetical protein
MPLEVGYIDMLVEWVLGCLNHYSVIMLQVCGDGWIGGTWMRLQENWLILGTQQNLYGGFSPYAHSI